MSLAGQEDALLSSDSRDSTGGDLEIDESVLPMLRGGNKLRAVQLRREETRPALKEATEHSKTARVGFTRAICAAMLAILVIGMLGSALW